jgi:HTH-type transcriptional regulator/antitoxin HigA
MQQPCEANMLIRPIRTKTDYRAAMQRLDAIWGASAKSPEADELEVLGLLVEEYEKKHVAVPKVDPVDLLLHVMEARQLTRKDLESYIGSRARVAEVINRVRPLSLEMIRRLAAGLDLPADLLIADYELRQAA